MNAFSKLFFILLLLVLFNEVTYAQPKSDTIQYDPHRKPDDYTLIRNDSIIEFENTEYKEGTIALYKYLDSKTAKCKGIPKQNKKVFTRVTISEKGVVEKVEILRPIKGCNLCDSVAKAILYDLPKWKPAVGYYKNGTKKTEKDQVMIRLKF